ncbi:hypothetical protein [uncultured Thiodictyon sp.]|uniref:hypothetical protein n=1 Tax=uncultured Thiodictyon sp. TaxID=1846217 RepID=UPI0025D52B89|nr:hypothetical protein [uncultured Thiodictyon sp.]
MSTDAVALCEWESAGPDRWPSLAGRRLVPQGPAARLAKALTDSGRLEVLELAQGLELRATSWVGRVTLDGLTITIRPKIPELPLLNLMRYAYGPRYNPQQRRDPVPRPDFVVRRRQQILAILDAKYRDLWVLALPREMLYQLAIYALTQPSDGACATILYPTLADAARDQLVAFHGILGGPTKARAILRPVHLLVLDGLLRAGSGLEAERQRQAMVSRLISRKEPSSP